MKDLLPDDAKKDEATIKRLQDEFGEGKVRVQVSSIEPEGGPTSGNTRVLVRGGPFKDMNLIYTKPKCKFGKYNMVVDATYVACTTGPTPIEEREGRHMTKVKIYNIYSKIFFRMILAYNVIIVQSLIRLKSYPSLFPSLETSMML